MDKNLEENVPDDFFADYSQFENISEHSSQPSNLDEDMNGTFVCFLVLIVKFLK